MCDACHTVSKWFVCILASMKPAMYHTICLDCYQEDTWQVKVASKEITTSVGSSRGYKPWVSKRKGNHSADRWEENIVGTSSGNSEDSDW